MEVASEDIQKETTENNLPDNDTTEATPPQAAPQTSAPAETELLKSPTPEAAPQTSTPPESESPKPPTPQVTLKKSPTPQAASKKPSPSQEAPRKSKKEDKNSKKDDKSAEQFVKSISEDNKKLLFYIKQSDKRHAMLQKEKEHLQHEFNKTVLVKLKLENLCRELQKQNKAIKEESLLKIREEEERRKETQAKFQNTLTEITTLLQQNNEKNVKLRDDNISMSEKFKSVVQQYQLREQQVDKMAKQMALESQLADAKLQKANLEHQADKERLLAEMEQLKVTLAQYKARFMELQGTETALKGQLAVYADKYDEFQNALVKSNQVFGGFKEQMDMMSKKIKKLEKESLSWKKKWETSQTALLEMCGERQNSEERAAATTRQLQHMQSLCRTLQAERTLLLNSLKEHNIERPPLPAPTPAPPPPPAPVQTPASDAKVDAMVANCAQLRQSLAHLQTQLNVLTNNKNGTTEEPAKSEKQKKSKSKKNKAEKQQQKMNSEKSDIKDTDNAEANTNSSNGNLESSITEIVSVVDTNQTNIENKGEDDCTDDKVDDKIMESLIQAINVANVNLCDLETVNEEVHNKIDTVNDLAQAVEELKVGDSGAISFEEVQKKIDIVKDLAQAVEELKVGDSGAISLDESNTDNLALYTAVKETSNGNISQITEISSNDETPHFDEVKSISQASSLEVD